MVSKEKKGLVYVKRFVSFFIPIKEVDLYTNVAAAQKQSNYNFPNCVPHAVNPQRTF